MTPWALAAGRRLIPWCLFPTLHWKPLTGNFILEFVVNFRSGREIVRPVGATGRNDVPPVRTDTNCGKRVPELAD
jgi:hypothetical protein